MKRFFSMMIALLMAVSMGCRFPVCAFGLELPPNVQIESEDLPYTPAAALLESISVAAASQSATDPGTENKIAVTVSIKNTGLQSVDSLAVSNGEATSSGLSAAAPFSQMLSLAAGAAQELSFEVNVPPELEEGNYPLSVRLACTDAGGSTLSSSRVVYVRIGARSGAPAGQTAAALAASRPHVIVTGFDIGGSIVYSGNTFLLKFNLKNTSSTSNIQNIKITVVAPYGEFIPTLGHSNTVYVDEIRRGAEREIQMELKAAYTAAGDYPLSIKVDYEDNTNQYYSTVEGIWIPLANVGTISVDSILVASTVRLGQRLALDIRFSNPSETDMLEVKLVISGNIETSPLEIGTGSLKSGQSNFVDSAVVFTQAGKQTLTLSFVCKDKTGNSYTIAIPDITVDVTQESSSTPLPTVPATDAGGANGPGAPEGFFSSPMTVAVAILVVTAAAGAIIFFFYRRNIKK